MKFVQYQQAELRKKLRPNMPQNTAALNTIRITVWHIKKGRKRGKSIIQDTSKPNSQLSQEENNLNGSLGPAKKT